MNRFLAFHWLSPWRSRIRVAPLVLLEVSPLMSVTLSRRLSTHRGVYSRLP
ncbi:Uncharacterised protein [Mycobacteroides abscessus subsp. abscessus]|nr:Uncharacterised protein [Mycobacteroides abscessus subsp. abscessus]